MSHVQLYIHTTVFLASLLFQLINSSAIDLTKITSPASDAVMFQNEMKFVYKFKGSPDSPYSALKNFLLRNAAERQISNSEMTNTTPRTATTGTVSATPGLLSNTHRIDRHEPSTTYPSENNYTMPSDRIKFFELYDSNTLEPATIEKENLNILNMSVILDNTTESTENTETSYKTESVYVTVKIKHSKKDIERQNELGQEKLIRAVKFQEQNKTIRSVDPNDEENILKLNEDQLMNVNDNDRTKTHIRNKDVNLTISRIVPWIEYPFAAVYVYERFQVHCDAAAVSQHWLIAAGSCLSRHQNYFSAEQRSAFVSYCGERWWNPERINYVKSTRVHPRYDRKDLIRRHIYNIGVIQVTASMASSCMNWSPITVMSYQYVAELEGSVGTAVGWGLDRYDTSYASTDLPKKLLAAYESVIYSNSCPGNTGYRNTEKMSKEAVSTVYCLSLPNYTDEEHDPVHGGILLVGGKLIALYLQEERQQWGSQSAQYTGVWRLMPWLLEVAKEPEEMDFFV